MNLSAPYLIKIFIFFNLFLIGSRVFAQQISIERIEMMPAFPQPYEMRDWQEVAQQYDALVFNLDATGQHMPLASIFENTVNYPEHAGLAIQSYVGTNSPPGKEAINVLPAVIGASLSGIDKSDQLGFNWVLMTEEYFNNRPEENIYLNSPVASSGNDWWYETMPNIFFYQLNDLYPNTGHFDKQFKTVASRWLESVKVMGGNDAPWSEAYMNYRAFDFSEMEPVEEGVKEPEAAGAIAWILYMAYVETGDDSFRKGAEWSMEYLNDLQANPSYELQMPYGAYIAARMNTELGTLYNIEQMLSWCFDVGPLRQWGAVVEEWGGIDMHGTIGEAREEFPGYVFNMNSFEQTGALVPLVRYDDRFAHAIGKWVLNVANASRFFYSEYLTDDMEDNEDWAETYDPHSVIAYEALREYEEGPYGTGDAMDGGWAETNLGLYGSSHVGIFGGIIDTTDVSGILQLDLLITDYYHAEAWPSWLFYNPYDVEKTFTAAFPQGAYDVYDAISNQVILENISGSALLNIPADSPLIAVLIPVGANIEYELNKALVENRVIDYNAGQQVDNFPPRIKAVASTDTIFPVNFSIELYCTAEDRETSNLDYTWEINEIAAGTGSTITATTPPEPGEMTCVCTVTDESGSQVSDSISLTIVEHINYPPQIDTLFAIERFLWLNDTTSLFCLANDPNSESLTYNWTSDGGSIQSEDSLAVFTAPGQEGKYIVSCQVVDTSGVAVSASLSVLVKNPADTQSGELVAAYNFNGNTDDHSGYNHHGIPQNISFAADPEGNTAEALMLPFANSKVIIQNTDALNFREGMTLAAWIFIEEFYSRESYPFSHGNWNNRWKLSLTEEKIRYTINGTAGVTDLDSEFKLQEQTWYHFAAVYDGAFLQVYINGELNAFVPYNGLINTTVYDLVFGQSLPDQSGYDFNGRMDDVMLFNYGLIAEEIENIYKNEFFGIAENTGSSLQGYIYPNPGQDMVQLKLHSDDREIALILLYAMDGQLMLQKQIILTPKQTIDIPVSTYPEGIYVLQVKSGKKSLTRKISVVK